MKIRASHAQKAHTQLVKGLKLAINVPLDTLRMGQKERKSVFCVHEAFMLLSVHLPVSPALRVVSHRIHQAIVSLAHRELTML